MTKRPVLPAPAARLSPQGSLPDPPRPGRAKTAGVVFDMDGVLFDSERACLSCWEQAAESLGLPGIRDVFFRCIGTNLMQTRQILSCAYAREHGKGIIESMLEKSDRLFREEFGGGRLPVKPGVRELLSFLSEKGVPTGLASSSERRKITEALDGAELTGFFSCIISGDAVKISKPDPEIYLLACREMELIPGETFAIEDSRNGIRSAHAAGMRPVMVPDLIPPDEEMRLLSSRICGDLFEVKAYLEDVMNGLLPP